MNNWRRLYAHLAPILPNTVLLSRVEHLARTAAPWFEPGPIEGIRIIDLIDAMFDAEDEEELRVLTVQLEDEVQLAAWKANRNERLFLLNHLHESKNYKNICYPDVFKHYRLEKPKLRP